MRRLHVKAKKFLLCRAQLIFSLALPLVPSAVKASSPGPNEHDGGFILAIGKASAPAAPSNLRAGASSLTEVDLFWSDNSSDELEFQIEGKTLNGSYLDVALSEAENTSAIVTNLLPATIYTFRVRAVNAMGASSFSNEITTSTSASPGPCISSAQALCLQQDRFRIQAYWQTASGPATPATGIKLTQDTGYFWFFDPANVELVAKVLNGCAFNASYWVFAGGLTNVHVLWTVTDMRTGRVRTYDNALGIQFMPVQDTAAFQTCP